MSRRAYAEAQRTLGRRVAAVFPARYPAELLWAREVVPVEVWDPPTPTGEADAHLPPMVCAVVRRGLSLLLNSQPVDLLLFPHTCDSLQNLSTLLPDLLGETRPCLFFYPPRAGEGDSARAFLLEEVRALSQRLDAVAGAPSLERLREAVRWGRERDEALRDLYDARARGELAATGEEFYRVVRRTEYLWPKESAEALRFFRRERGGRRPAGVPLVLSGVLPTPKDLLRCMDERGLVVAEDDFLGLGRRFPRKVPALPADPLEAAAERLLALPPCPTQGASVASRLTFLEELARRSSARAVVFFTLKFCEPELFDLPFLVEGLRERGLPALVLETEPGEETPAALLTRLEAFVESLP